MYFRVNFEVHSGYGGPSLSIPVRSGPFRLVNTTVGKHSYLHHRYLVCLLTIKYVLTAQYLSISFLCIHNLRLSHFSQLKGCSRATLSYDSSYHTSSDRYFTASTSRKHVTQVAEGSYHLQLIRSDLDFTLWSAINRAGISHAQCTLLSARLN